MFIWYEDNSSLFERKKKTDLLFYDFECFLLCFFFRHSLLFFWYDCFKFLLSTDDEKKYRAKMKNRFYCVLLIEHPCNLTEDTDNQLGNKDIAAHCEGTRLI